MSELSTTSSQPARTVEAVTLEIQTLKYQANEQAKILLGYSIEIGRRLVELKAMLPHGRWGVYIKEQFSYSQSTANNYMRLFEEFGAAQQSIFGPEANSQSLGNLSYTKALRLLALPADERETFVEEHHVEDMSTRELEAAIKERDEALRRAEEDRAEREAAEQAREKIAQDMALANERVAQLSQELEELRVRPVEVAVQHAEEEELEQARREAAADARARVEALEAELAAARKQQTDLLNQHQEMDRKLKEARQERKDAMEAQKAAREELKQAREALERARKELRASGNKEITQFMAYFGACQVEFSRMMDILRDLKSGGGAEDMAKLTTACGALLEAMAKQLAPFREEGAASC